MNTTTLRQEFSIHQADRNRRNNHRSLVVWFTGLSGAGKSTLANTLEQRLFQKNIQTFILDGDCLRNGINADLDFSEVDRNENLRRVAEIAKLFSEAGLVVIAAFISPREAQRKMVKKIVGEVNFVEIFVDTSLETCEKRDVKGLYKKARNGQLSNFTGIDAPYEIPKHPDLIIKTEEQTIETSMTQMESLILEKIKLPASK